MEERDDLYENDSIDFSSSNENKKRKMSVFDRVRKRNEAEDEAIAEEDELNDKGRLSKRQLLLYMILPAFGAALVTGVLAFIIGMSLGASNAPEPEYDMSNVREPAQITHRQSLEEAIRDVRESQLTALHKQFEAVSSTETVTLENDRIARANVAVANYIDPFLDRLLAMDRYADAGRMDAVRSDLTEYVSDSMGADALYNIVTGQTPARDMEENGFKSGTTFTTLVGMDAESREVYLTFTPFTTDTRTVNVIYLFRFQGGGYIGHAEYIGYMDTSGHVDVQGLFESITHAFQGY